MNKKYEIINHNLKFLKMHKNILPNFRFCVVTKNGHVLDIPKGSHLGYPKIDENGASIM